MPKKRKAKSSPRRPKDAPPPAENGPGPGRPLKYKTVEELQVAINMYFDKCDKEFDTRKWAHDEIVKDHEGKRICINCGLPPYRKGCMVTEGRLKVREPYTITGLALALGFRSRQSLLEYEGEVEGREKSPEFADAVKAAKLRVENYLENHGLYGDMAPAKAIFGLSNYNWKNPQHIDHTSKGQPIQGGVLQVPMKKPEGVE